MVSKSRMTRARPAARTELPAGEQPVFDLDNLSWTDSKRVSINGQRLQRGGAPTVEELERIFAEMEATLAKVVVAVPRGWLVKGAPDEIDWSDPASFQWLQGRMMMPLIQAMQAQNQGN